jgi:hypothetical protein
MPHGNMLFSSQDEGKMPSGKNDWVFVTVSQGGLLKSSLQPDDAIHVQHRTQVLQGGSLGKQISLPQPFHLSKVFFSLYTTDQEMLSLF